MEGSNGRYGRTTTSLRLRENSSSCRYGSPTGRSFPATPLRRNAEKKKFCPLAIAGKSQRHQRPPNNLLLPAQTRKIAGCLFVHHVFFPAVYVGDVIPLNQRGMGVPKPFDNNHKPICYQPWRDPTVRVHPHSCAIKTLLT